MGREKVGPILGLDTSTDACSVALWRDGAVERREAVEARGGHAERLVPMVRGVMAAAGMGFGALEALAVTIGPGSFTGIRIGLATARGLALAAARPLIGCTTLEVLAAAAACAEHGSDAEHAPSGTVLAVLDARRGRVYAQAFRSDPPARAGMPLGGDLSPLFEPRCMPVEALADMLGPRDRATPLLVAGTGARAAAEALGARGVAVRQSRGRPHPDAGVLVRLAAARVDTASAHPPVRPLYLREPGAEAPRAGLPRE